MNDDKQSVDKNTDYVESILTDIGGTFNRFQIFNYILFCIPFALSGTFGLSYVFTTLDLDYRYVFFSFNSISYFYNSNLSICILLIHFKETFRMLKCCLIRFICKS